MFEAWCRWRAWKPAAGFRFSPTDAAAVAVCAAITCGLWPILDEMAAIFPIVLGHFFLFCNVFRVRRIAELLWGGLFVLNVAGWAAVNRFIWPSFTWPAVLWTQLPVTLTTIVVAVLSRDYHGIGYRHVPWGRRPETERRT